MTNEDDLMYFESESEDDEPVAKDDINCTHEPENGKYRLFCCLFNYNSDAIMDIIHKCSFECTYETGLELKELEETLTHYLCRGGEHSTEYVESIKTMLSTHRTNLEDELHNIVYDEFRNSVQDEYHLNYYGEAPKFNISTCATTCKVSSARKLYSSSNRAYRDIEFEVKRAISKMNFKVCDIVLDVFDVVEEELVHFISTINIECEKFREIITYICRKVLTCIPIALNVDLRMECIFEYRMNVQ